MEKLRASAAGEPTSIVPDHSAPLKPSRPTAADILGLNRQRNTGRQREISLEMELDQYLSDPNQGTGILEYWQVGIIFLTPYNLNLFTDMHIIYRNITIATLIFFVLQWISYRFRHQVFPVKGFFHLGSRQWHLEDPAFLLS